MWRNKILVALALISGAANAQYAHGDEIPLRPTKDPDGVQKTMSLEEYTAQQIVQQAMAKQNPSPPPADNNLPVEKLTPPALARGSTRTVVVAQAIYRCDKGGEDVYVDEEGKRKFQQCMLWRAEKTAEIPIDPPPAPVHKPANACKGAVFYRGKTYVFNDNVPCPIPDEVWQRLIPAASAD